MNSDKKLITDSNRLSLFVTNKEKMLRKLQELVSLLNFIKIDVTHLLHPYSSSLYFYRKRKNQDILQWSVSDNSTDVVLPYLEEDEWGDYFVLNLHAKVGDMDIMTISLEDDGLSHWFHLESGHQCAIKVGYIVFGMNPKELCQYFSSFDELYNFVERRITLFTMYSSCNIKL